MKQDDFNRFFTGAARSHLARAIADALAEDGVDIVSNAVFSPEDVVKADIVARQDTLLAGLYIIPLVLEETATLEPGFWELVNHAEEGSHLCSGALVTSFESSARVLLRAERVILNFLSHLSGIANLVSCYVRALEGTGVRLLDTRKTLPGLRYPEKYAVLVGGGHNHRKNLAEILMLKDNHIDAAGGITAAVARLRLACSPTPPIEVECRNLNEVREAVACGVSRIMLDNMLDRGEDEAMQHALALIPPNIEVEISGGITLANIGRVAGAEFARKADFVSVGRLTHSAPAANFSLLITQ